MRRYNLGVNTWVFTLASLSERSNQEKRWRPISTQRGDLFKRKRVKITIYSVKIAILLSGRGLYRLNTPMISSRQIRAARALLGWSQQDLADKSIVSVNAIRRLESSQVDPRWSTISAVKAALEMGGVEFQYADTTKGEGVRLSAPE